MVDFSLAPDQAPLVGSLQPPSRLELHVVHLLHHDVVGALEEILDHLSSPGEAANLLVENFGTKRGQHIVFVSCYLAGLWSLSN